MTYAVDAMTLLTHTSSLSSDLLADLAVITLAGVTALDPGRRDAAAPHRLMARTPSR